MATQETNLPASTRPDRLSSRRTPCPAAVVLLAAAAAAQTQGPSSSRPPYLVPTATPSAYGGITSIVTSTNLVPETGAPGTTHEFGGTPDGMGAFDNGDGTVTVLVNHEHASTSGVVRAHGGRGAYVEAVVVDKNTLAVVSSSDLMRRVIDAAGVVHDTAHANAISLHRFCSGDLAPATGYFNAASGLGTQDRIFMHGEEGSATGYAIATVVTGADRGSSYLLARMNLSTNGSGLTGVGAWENLLANPAPQDLTVLIGTNDGGSGIMLDSLAVYVGTKQATGSPVDRAGLTNGTLAFVNVVGSPLEIVNTTTRATNIVSGTRFTLGSTAATRFSRPEDGAWSPVNPRQFWFATTDRLDTATTTGPNPTIGASGTANQTGRSRLWRLTFDDIANPALGGVIDLMIDGSKNGTKVQMLDNVAVGADGRVYLNEDPGSTTYNAKVWCYDPASDVLTMLAKCDPALWGELAAVGGTPGAIAPHNDNKEVSGILDVTGLFPTAPGETALLVNLQDHTTNAALATTSSVEGGQMLLLRVRLTADTAQFGTGCGAPLTLAAAPGSQPRMGAAFATQIGNLPAGHLAFMAIGFSDVAVGATPLPLALAAIGQPQCLLYHDLAYGFLAGTTSTSASTASFGVTVPTIGKLAGFDVFFQAWSTDGTGFAMSNALKAHLGF